MFSLFRNGALVTAIDADDVKIDLTGGNPVFIFIKGNREAEVDSNCRSRPYLDWEPKGNRERRKKERRDREERERIAREHPQPKHDDKKDKRK